MYSCFRGKKGGTDHQEASPSLDIVREPFGKFSGRFQWKRPKALSVSESEFCQSN